MRNDSDIKRDVEDELRWDPDIDATDIGVAVKQGVVTLSGFVHSYSHKYEAETDAKRVLQHLADLWSYDVSLVEVDTSDKVLREYVLSPRALASAA